MKKFQRIIALTVIITIASSTSLYADNCGTAGVTTGQTCWKSINGGGNVPNTVTYATACTSSAAGCVFINCPNNCTCNTKGYVCPGGGGTDCSSTTCNPVWGTIDNTTHIQQGQAREPDTSNNCNCINVTGFGSTIYRCIAGYYDTRNNLTSIIGSKPTCEQCPSLAGVAGTSKTGITQAPSNTGITSCYIPYNTEITDDTGTYIFYGTTFLGNGGCYYTE